MSFAALKAALPTARVLNDERQEAVNRACPGWSGSIHAAFFRSVLQCYPGALYWLVCGVYQGRDVATIATECRALDMLRRERLRIRGVDLFSAESCADWPEEKRGRTWEANGFGAAPTFDRALFNLHALQEERGVTLTQGASLEYLQTTPHEFDVVYLDTSHDYATVRDELAAVARVCSGPETLICGDDYTAMESTWEVTRAVKEAFAVHQVYRGTIWFARAGDLAAKLTR